MKNLKPGKVKLITSVFSRDPELIRKTSLILEKMFGGIDFRSPIMDFTHTEYYNDEMGRGLKRMLFSFNRPIRPESAYKTKLKTNAIEKKIYSKRKTAHQYRPGLSRHVQARALLN